MNRRYRFHTFFKYVAYAFYPATTMIICLLTMVAFDTIMIIFMHRTNSESVYNILMAMVTGISASFIVSIILELSGNVQRNKLAWHRLFNYFIVVMDFGYQRQIITGEIDIIAIKSLFRSIAQGLDYDEGDKEGLRIKDYFEKLGTDNKGPSSNKDIIEVTWEQLPSIMPVLISTLEHNIEFLTYKEIEALQGIKMAYEAIKIAVGVEVDKYIREVSNEETRGFSYNDSFEDIIGGFPKWYQDFILSKRKDQESAELRDLILKDSLLIDCLMSDFDISSDTLKKYDIDKDKNRAFRDIFFDSMSQISLLHESEGDSEQNLSNEEKYKDIVSFWLSFSCSEIAEFMESLEKSASRRPYVDMEFMVNEMLHSSAVSNIVKSLTGQMQ